MARVVVLDDSPTRRLAIRGWLLRLGHDVQCHASLQDVLARVDPGDVELVLAALIMEDSNGFDSGAALRGRGFAPILLLADHAHATDDIWAKGQGLAGVVSWPLTESVLQQAIGGLQVGSLELPWTRGNDEDSCHE